MAFINLARIMRGWETKKKIVFILINTSIIIIAIGIFWLLINERNRVFAENFRLGYIIWLNDILSSEISDKSELIGTLTLIYNLIRPNLTSGLIIGSLILISGIVGLASLIICTNIPNLEKNQIVKIIFSLLGICLVFFSFFLNIQSLVYPERFSWGVILLFIGSLTVILSWIKELYRLIMGKYKTDS